VKVADADVLMIPGFGGSEPDHWQSRWHAKLSTARRVEQADWERADRSAWTGAIEAAVEASRRPAILVAHSLGVFAVAHAASRLGGKVAGAFLVGPSDWERPNLLPGVEHDFAPVPLAPLPFPSVLVASRNDPYCEMQRASDFAEAWGSEFVDAGDAGHINVASGHGPWPEGLMKFAGFLSKLR
jgi:predicted alpha/beta hydrolase family esterase